MTDAEAAHALLTRVREEQDPCGPAFMTFATAVYSAATRGAVGCPVAATLAATGARSKCKCNIVLCSAVRVCAFVFCFVDSVTSADISLLALSSRQLTLLIYVL